MATGDPMIFSHNGASVLLPNPSAEVYTGAAGIVDFWASSGTLAGTPTQASDHTYAGLYSQKIILTAGQTAPLSQYFYVRHKLQMPGLNAALYFANAKFTIGCWLRTNDSTLLTFKMRVSICNNAWAELAGYDTVIDPAINTWTAASYVLDLGASPNAALYGIEVQLHTNLVVDNVAATPSVWWDDLSMYDSLTFSKNPSMPDDGRMFLKETSDRLANNTLTTYRHPASTAKNKQRLNFSLITQAQMERLRQFWLYGKAITWTPNLPKFPSTLIVKIVGVEFTYVQSSALIGAGYKGSIDVEEV
jgi:hypothetical protein